MNEEWFDVVDEADRVVGRELRAEVHRRSLRHRAVHVLVFDSAGHLFLQKRSLTKDTWPGAWDSSCSGHVDSGEDYDAAARRELVEELGIEESVGLTRLFKHAACAATGHEFVWVYRIVHAGALAPNPDELDGGEWFARVAVDRLVEEAPESVSLSFRHTWQRWKAELGGD